MNEKEKNFSEHYDKVTENWLRKSKKGFYNLYKSVWMNGFETCEKIYDRKLQKYLDEKGI